MVKTGLHIEKGQEYIAVKVEGIPLGRYASQIFHLLSQYGLEAVGRSLAQPIYTDQGIVTEWFHQSNANLITPWREASLSQQISCVSRLIEMARDIDHLRHQISQHNPRSVTIIDQILQNLTVIPSTDAIFCIDQHPLLLHWGYYSQDRIAVDLLELHQQLQQKMAALLPPSPPEQCSVPAPTKLKTGYRYYCAAAVAGAVIAGVMVVNLQQPSAKPSQPSEPVILSTQDDLRLSLQALRAASQRLPLQAAEFSPPPPKVKLKNGILQLPLMIPAQSRYQGNTDFLNGNWVTHLKINAENPPLTYRFSHGKVITHSKKGRQYCTTTSKAAFTTTGALIISTAKKRCKDGTRYPAITLVCEKSAPNTQCQWQQNSSTTQPVVLYSEKKQ